LIEDKVDILESYSLHPPKSNEFPIIKHLDYIKFYPNIPIFGI
jgi:hypothetical protein